MLPRIFQREPVFFGPIDTMQPELHHPRILHVTILKEADPHSLTYDLSDIAAPLAGRLHMVSALGSEDFYSDWCLTFGTTRTFENAGIILLEEEQQRRLETPTIVGDNWRLRRVKRRRGGKGYSEAEMATQHNLGAQVYRLERLLVAAIPGHTDRDTANRVREILERHLSGFKLLTKGADMRSQEVDHAFRRLRKQLGPQRLKALHGQQALRQIGTRFESEGRALVAPKRLTDGWERTVPELAQELDMLQHLLCLCRRAQRMENVVDAGLGLDGLDRVDDPVVFLRQPAAEELMGFGSPANGDQMPSLAVLTRIALDFDYNAAELYPSLGPVGLHLAAACAIGRSRRGMLGTLDAHEAWGLRGLARYDFDAACFPDLQAARNMARAAWPASWSGNVETEPVPIQPRPAFHIPVLLKRGR